MSNRACCNCYSRCTNAHKFTIAWSVGCVTSYIWQFLKWVLENYSKKQLTHVKLNYMSLVSVALSWKEPLSQRMCFVMFLSLTSCGEVCQCWSEGHALGGQRLKEKVQGLNLRTDKCGYFLLSTFNVSWFCSLKTTYVTLDSWSWAVLHLIRWGGAWSGACIC